MINEPAEHERARELLVKTLEYAHECAYSAMNQMHDATDRLVFIRNNYLPVAVSIAEALGKIKP